MLTTEEENALLRAALKELINNCTALPRQPYDFEESFGVPDVLMFPQVEYYNGTVPVTCRALSGLAKMGIIKVFP